MITKHFYFKPQSILMQILFNILKKTTTPKLIAVGPEINDVFDHCTCGAPGQKLQFQPTDLFMLLLLQMVSLTLVKGLHTTLEHSPSSGERTGTHCWNAPSAAVSAADALLTPRTCGCSNAETLWQDALLKALYSYAAPFTLLSLLGGIP